MYYGKVRGVNVITYKYIFQHMLENRDVKEWHSGG